MRLDYDCIRDVMLLTEEKQGINSGGFIDTLGPNDYVELRDSNKYTDDVILYTLKQLIDNGMLDGDCLGSYAGLDISVNDITPKGHEFLENTRQDTVWNKTKDLAKKAGSSSVSSLVRIAEQVITGMITGLLTGNLG